MNTSIRSNRFGQIVFVYLVAYGFVMFLLTADWTLADDCYIEEDTCTCDSAVGGPGWVVECEPNDCPNVMIECEPTTKCKVDPAGKEGCVEFAGTKVVVFQQGVCVYGDCWVIATRTTIDDIGHFKPFSPTCYIGP